MLRLAYKFRWEAFRAMGLLLLLLSPVSPTTSADYSQLFIYWILIPPAFAAIVFFWIIGGPDDAPRYTLRELFVSAPMWPLSRSTCAIWIYLGILAVLIGLTFIRDMLLTRTFQLFEAISSVYIGAVFIFSCLLAYHWKTKSRTGRCT